MGGTCRWRGTPQGLVSPLPSSLCTCKVVTAGNHKEVICLSPEVCKLHQQEGGREAAAGAPELPPSHPPPSLELGEGASAVLSVRMPATWESPYIQNTAYPNPGLEMCPLRPDQGDA